MPDDEGAFFPASPMKWPIDPVTGECPGEAYTAPAINAIRRIAAMADVMSGYARVSSNPIPECCGVIRDECQVLRRFVGGVLIPDRPPDGDSSQ